MQEHHIYWVALNRVKGIGAVRLRALLDHFGDARAAWEAQPGALAAAGLTPLLIDSLVDVRSNLDLARLAEDLEKHQIQVLTWQDEAYPRRLADIDQAPPVLYVRGELQPDDEWAVAVVGTRRISRYGRQVAEELGAFLAQQGITVVSGLARGVDGVTHQAALNAGGRTLAVMAHGLDTIYPNEHRGLAERIMQHGALISDYGVGVPPDSLNFPPRNRIISGLSIATVVVEAGQTSGALITADFAVEQGREVFMVPGNIYAPSSKGTNRYIQQGAQPLLTFDELLQVLDLTQITQQKSARVVLPENSTEALLFGLLGHEPLHINEIGALAEMPIHQVSSALALMELKGLVRQVGGMSYVAARELPAEYNVEAKTE
jgi:DNA processing protein